MLYFTFTNLIGFQLEQSSAIGNKADEFQKGIEIARIISDVNLCLLCNNYICGEI
ncbi:hypothetical protein AM1BK_34650 [Neobacillus kokaensis]|uniref:Uncharacterized protein n=1 Tax=Neobacillus kokaensis TaxID=2759023 RepID=A0ABQ3N8F6_9BACI|nr:hypothetical protein AM1BK_34650 [Neobacillus kokaensis]